MEKINLGRTDIQVARICLGCWAMGGSGWANVDDERSVATVQAALDAEINFIDTAEAYGMGHSEEVIGRAIVGKRKEVIIATKPLWNRATPQELERTLGDSLKRIGTDYIDLYQIHWPHPRVPIEKSVEIMSKLKERGKIRAIGVSNFDLPLMERAVKVAKIDSLQSPFNILWREIDSEIIPFCREHRISLLSYSSIGQGLLTGKYRNREAIPDITRKGNMLFKEGVFEEALKVADTVIELAGKYHKTPAQVAINWVLCTEGIDCALVGARTPQQITENAGAAGWRLTREDFGILSTKGREVYNLLPPNSTMWNWRPR